MRFLDFDVVAAKGISTTSGNIVNPGNGGRVQGRLSVTSNSILYLYVGGTNTVSGIDIRTPVYNASDIRTSNEGILDSTSLQNRIIVAGGGGNGGNSTLGRHGLYPGGAGGGLVGNGSNFYGCTGGTQTEGGHPGAYDLSGTAGQFGLGGTGSGWNTWNSGAGGAGWYGGGGGGTYAFNSVWGDTSGGGGGSSYTHPTLCSNVEHTQGYNNSNGYIIITPIF